MEVFLIILFLIIGLILIIKGGDFFVDAASWLAEEFGIPQFVIGATIVSMATTLPELIVSVIAAVEGNVEMAIGNAVGTVVANTGLIMGISLIFAPFFIKRKDIAVKGLLLILSLIVLSILTMKGSLNVWYSFILIAIFIYFIIDNILSAKRQLLDEPLINKNEKIKTKSDKKIFILNIIKFILGGVGIYLGAKLLVDNGCKLAEMMGVPQGIVAVTLVAVGTSLPELVTMITSLIKKKGALSAGNIIGANIIDLTVILPVCAMISDGSLPVTMETITIDFPFALGIGIIAIIPTIVSQKFARWQGLVMVSGYIAYLVLRILAL